MDSQRRPPARPARARPPGHHRPQRPRQPPLIDAECNEILRVSRRNNARDGITGLLVVGRTRFLQLLEGPADAISATFERIKADKRHYAAVVIEGREVAARACADWAMGYARGGDAPEHASLPEVVAKLVEPIEDASLKAQFVGFGEIQDGAPNASVQARSAA